MARDLRVTHTVLSLDTGGLERIVVDLVREGRRLGQEVSVVCLERAGTLAPQAEALGARVVTVGKAPGLRLSVRRPLCEALADLRPNVLHTHQVGALFYAGPVARRLGIPVVVHTEHINNIRKCGSSFTLRQRMSWLWWWSARYARRFFCVSDDIAAEMDGRRIVPRDKLRVILNGINTEPFQEPVDRTAVRRSLNIPPDSAVVGTVGRLNEVKRQDLLIRGFARLVPERKDAHLLLVGDGPMREELGELARSLGIDRAVHFAGYQSRPEQFLGAMDVFALTSRMEGLPLAVLEAWAAGLPVVCSAVGGVPDLIAPGRNGLLFPSGDEKALVEHLRDLLNSPDRARAFGAVGRREVLTRYDLRRMAADYEGHYRELLGRQGESGRTRVAG